MSPPVKGTSRADALCIGGKVLWGAGGGGSLRLYPGLRAPTASVGGHLCSAGSAAGFAASALHWCHQGEEQRPNETAAEQRTGRQAGCRWPLNCTCVALYSTFTVPAFQWPLVHPFTLQWVLPSPMGSN